MKQQQHRITNRNTTKLAVLIVETHVSIGNDRDTSLEPNRILCRKRPNVKQMVSLPLVPHFFEVSRLPASIESGRFRPIDAEVDKPSFPRNRLDPLVLMSRRSSRTEVEIGRLRCRNVFKLKHRT